MIIGVTGPRPDRLDGDYTYKGKKCLWLRNELERKFIQYKPDAVISGVALGFDTISALLAIDHGIALIAAIPFIGQEKLWSKQAQELYNKILSHPKTIVKIICSPSAEKWKYQKRNEWIVNECDKLVGATDGFTDIVGGDPKEFADILFHKYTVDDFAYHDDMHYFGVVKYFEETVIPHKIAVYESGIWLTEQSWFEKYLKGFAIEDFKYNLWIHDMSKFCANEAFGYAMYNRSTGNGKEAFEASWHHHKNNNPHHPEYWFNPNREGKLEPIPMPALYVMEMIADWMGAGKTYGSTLEQWLPGNLHKFRFGHSRQLVQNILGEIGITVYSNIDADSKSPHPHCYILTTKMPEPTNIPQAW